MRRRRRLAARAERLARRHQFKAAVVTWLMCLAAVAWLVAAFLDAISRVNAVN